LYVLGGAKSGKSSALASRYNPSTDTWEQLPELPAAREHCAAGAIGGVVYVVGGRIDTITGVQPESYALDPITQTWTEIAWLPMPRGGLAGAVLGGRLYAFGGEGNATVSSGVFPNIDVYDPATDTWGSAPPMLIPRHGYGAATLDNKIYLAGGATRQGAGATTDVSVFSLE
jgi:N-acetylneuraminic acid mutarotase